MTPDPVTLVISELVRPQRIGDYEGWAHGLHQVLRTVPGFRGIDVIRPSDHSHPEYVTILKFDSYDTLRAWQTSETYRGWLAKLADLIVGTSDYQHGAGLELWFTRPQGLPGLASPPFYKQVIVGIIGVYPLILLFDHLLRPLTRDLPRALGILVVVVPVTIVLTYPVLPLLTKLLNRWLYPRP